MRTQVKLACLACRASKVRCDGQNPCASCISNKRPCHYRASRRGGARRGSRYQNALTSAPGTSVATPSSVRQSASTEATDASLDGFGGPVSPFSTLADISDMDDVHNRPETTTETSIQTLTAQTNINETTTQSSIDQECLVLRAYRCEEDLINAYYIYIHLYFPLLPQPAVPQYKDCPVAISLQDMDADLSRLPFQPTSPLSWALMSILVLIPILDDPHPMQEQATLLRQSYADIFAREALKSVQESVENPDLSSNHHRNATHAATELQSSLHLNVPLNLEPVLALLLLSMYEYCHCGSRSKMRARVNQALTIAMDMSLHTLSPDAPESLDAKRRAWWATIFLVYQSSIFNNMSPIILVNDPRITTPLTEFRCCLEPWPLLVKAQDGLYECCYILRELMSKESRAGLSTVLPDRIRELDTRLVVLAAESDSCRCITNQQGAEASATRTMWLIARVFIHASRIKLHRLRAFLDHAFLGEDCNAILTDHMSLRSTQGLSSSQMAEIKAAFPFTERESMNICLKSSLTVSRIFRHLPSPNPFYSDTEFLSTNSLPISARLPSRPRSLPYMLCCELESVSVLIMLLQRIHTLSYSGDFTPIRFLLSNPQRETEKQDAERLCEELQNGIESLISFLQSDSIFETVGNMAKEVEAVYNTLLLDRT